MTIATFAAGCFWGVEALFQQTPGVTNTRVGYMGGYSENPTYEEVCTEGTDHAESVEVTFDPEQISYNELLTVFFENHNPTTPNRQGPDIGRQYRSIIFYHDASQKNQAEKMKFKLDASKKYPDPVVTEILPATELYQAEEYHQSYLEKKGLVSCDFTTLTKKNENE